MAVGERKGYGMRGALAAIALMLLGAITAPGTALAASSCATVPTVTERCPLWTATYNHPGGRGGAGPDIQRGSALSATGARLAVVGTSYDDGTANYDAVVAVFSTLDGHALGRARYDGPSSQYDTFSSVAFAPDATTVYAAGRSQGADGDLDWVVGAFDAATGQTRWITRHVGPGAVDDVAWRITASPDGSRVYAAGVEDDVAGSAANSAALVIAFDAATGQETWTGRYSGPGFDTFNDLAMSPSGDRVYAAGRTATGSGYDLAVVAFDAREGAEPSTAGSITWASTYDAGGDEDGTDIEVTGDGSRIAVGGSSTGGTTRQDWLVAVFDDTGARRWAGKVGGAQNADDTIAGVAVAGGKVFAAGTVYDAIPSLRDYWVVAYDLATGTEAWRTSYGTPGNWSDYARGVAANATGSKVFVTGYSVYPYMEIQPFIHVEYGGILTAAFNGADGSRAWVARHNSSGTGDDVGQQVLVAPSGAQVYVAGTFVYNGVYSLQGEATAPQVPRHDSYDLAALQYQAN